MNITTELIMGKDLTLRLKYSEWLWDLLTLRLFEGDFLPSKKGKEKVVSLL